MPVTFHIYRTVDGRPDFRGPGDQPAVHLHGPASLLLAICPSVGMDTSGGSVVVAYAIFLQLISLVFRGGPTFIERAFAGSFFLVSGPASIVFDKLLGFAAAVNDSMPRRDHQLPLWLKSLADQLLARSELTEEQLILDDKSLVATATLLQGSTSCRVPNDEAADAYESFVLAMGES